VVLLSVAIKSADDDTSKAAARPEHVRTRTRDRKAKQQALLLAARHLFGSKGFERATTSEIAALAGCAEGLIHRYFGGKSGLLAAVLRSHALRQFPAEEEFPESGEFEAIVRSALEGEINNFWRDRDFLRVVMQRAIIDPEIAKLLGEIVSETHLKTIAARLRRAQPAIPAGEAEDVAHILMLLAFALGCVHQGLFTADPVASRPLADQIAGLLTRIFGKSQSRSAAASMHELAS
jgi:AcrR family transcriptional regulator